MAEQAEDVKNPVETETTTPESSTEETNDDGVFSLSGEDISEESTEESEEQGGSDAEADAEAKAQTPEPKTEETPPKNAEMRKQQLNSEIRDKVAERNALRKEIAELNRQKYQLKSQKDLPSVDDLTTQINPDTGDYYTRSEAKLAHLEAELELERQEKQMNEYTEQVVDNRMRLADEVNRALKDFPMFDDESDLFDKDLTAKADKIVNNLIMKDPKTGEIIGSRGSIYDVYEAIANATKAAETSGKIAGRKATMDMMNSADVVGSSSGSGSDEDDDDPFLRGLQRARSRYM